MINIQATKQIIQTIEVNNFSEGSTYGKTCTIEDKLVKNNGCIYYSPLINNNLTFDKLYIEGQANYQNKIIYKTIFHFDDNVIFELKFNDTLDTTKGEPPIQVNNIKLRKFYEEYGYITPSDDKCNLTYYRNSHFENSQGTVMMWIRFEDINTPWTSNIIGNQYYNEKWMGIDIRFDGHNFGSNIFDGINHGFFPTGWNKNSFQGEWTHFITTWDNSTKLMAVYINGILIGEKYDNYTSSDFLTNKNMYILRATNIEDCSNVSIANLIILNRSIQKEEIQTVFDYWHGGGIPILVYHGISDEELYNWSIDIDNFYKTIEWLSNEGYNTITLSEFYNWTKGEFILPHQPVILTFDDSLENTYINAKDIMKSKKFKGVMFALTNYQGSIFQSQEVTTWSELKDLLNNYNWEIGSHTTNHVNGNSANFNEELNKSYSDILNNLNFSTISFAYPNYIINDQLKNSENVNEIYKVARGGYQDEKFNTKYTPLMYLRQNVLIRKQDFDFNKFKQDVRGHKNWNSQINDTYINADINALNSLENGDAILFKFNITTNISYINIKTINKNKFLPKVVDYSNNIVKINIDFDDSNQILLINLSNFGYLILNNIENIVLKNIGDSSFELILINLTKPFNNIYNLSGANLIDYDVNNYSTVLSPFEEIKVIEYLQNETENKIVFSLKNDFNKIISWVNDRGDAWFAENLFIEGFIQLQNVSTGTSHGREICIDSNNQICICDSCK